MLHTRLSQLLPTHLHALCADKVFAKGNRLFVTAERPAHMFFVTAGEVVLERVGEQGNTVILQRTRQGFVSEASLGSSKYHCDARAVTDTTVTLIPVKSIDSALKEDPEFSSRWINMLNTEVKRLRMHCERLSLTKVQDRLLHLLATEGTSGCYPIGSGLKSIAGELGVTHEALYRCVAALEKQSHLQRKDGQLIILKPVAT